MYGDHGLSNHGLICEPERYSTEGDDISHDPLHYFTEVTHTLEILEAGTRFTKARQLKDNGIYLSIPNKVIKQQDGRMWVHTRIYRQLVAKKLAWLDTVGKLPKSSY